MTPWTAARQASLSITNSRSLLKLMPSELVMPSSHLIRCRPRHKPLRKNREGLTWWPSDKDSTLPVQGVQVRSLGGIKNPHTVSPGTCVLNCAQLFLTLCAAPVSMEFSRQEHWSGLRFPPQGIFPSQGSNPHLLHLQAILYR